MEPYKERLSRILAETGALFFDKGLMLKDGRPTPYFVNLGGFSTGRLILELGSFFSEMLTDNSLTEEIDIIVGPSYKGSAIASAAVAEIFRKQGIDLSFDYDRKEAKAHGERSSAAALFVNNTFFDGCRIFIVDDVVTSMETKYELIEKIDAECRSRGFSYDIRGLGIAVDREQTAAVYDKKGKAILDTKGLNPVKDLWEKTGISFFSIAGIREIVAYLYSSEIPLLISGVRRAMDEATKNEFDVYMETYGRDDIVPG
ncbi:MAG: orotate phosphoribosyltransferase [Thermodesulfobacteriota bacterium]